MKLKTISLTLVPIFLAALTVTAGEVCHMKCEAKAGKDGKPCGYTQQVGFGGGMFFDAITGYCRSCEKFVQVTWTRENIPDEMKGRMQAKPRPKPLGEVWDAATGKILTINACPKCEGPFLEIKNFQELKHCPSCNQAHFVVDKDKPIISVD